MQNNTLSLHLKTSNAGMFLGAAIVYCFVPQVRNDKVTGSNPTPVRFESTVSALSELSINCTMAWVAYRQVRAMLYATLAVS